MQHKGPGSGAGPQRYAPVPEDPVNDMTGRFSLHTARFPYGLPQEHK